MSSLRVPLALGAMFLLIATATLLPTTAQAASTNYPPFNVSITGPSLLPVNGSGLFYAVASGGPAEQVDGNYVGNYTFTAQIIGLDTAGSFVSPVSGAFQGQDANLSVGGLNHTGTYTLEINVTSRGVGAHPINLTQVFSQQFQIVVPYIVTATVQNLNTFEVSGAAIRVSLDGVVVGSLGVPSLLPSASVQVKYNYTTLGLSPGYHTFTLTLVSIGGLLQFSNGEASTSSTFYVQGAAPDYTLYYLSGISFTFLAILISLMIFGPRRPRRKKSP